MLSTTVWRQVPEPDPLNPYTRTRIQHAFAPSGFLAASWVPVSSEGIISDVMSPAGVIRPDGLSGIDTSSWPVHAGIGVALGLLAGYLITKGFL